VTHAEGQSLRIGIASNTSSGSGAVGAIANTVQEVVGGVGVVGDGRVSSLQDGALGEAVLITDFPVTSTLFGVLTEGINSILDVASDTVLSDDLACANIEGTGQVVDVLLLVASAVQVGTGLIPQQADSAGAEVELTTQTMVVDVINGDRSSYGTDVGTILNVNIGVGVADVDGAVFIVGTQGQTGVNVGEVAGTEGLLGGTDNSSASVGVAGGVSDNAAKAAEVRGDVGNSVVQALIESASTSAATQLAQEGGVGANAGSTGVNVHLGAQSAGRAGQDTSSNGTKAASHANEGVTVAPNAGGAVKGNTVFQLEDSLQAIAEVFSTLETDVGGVGSQTVAGLDVGGGSAGAGSAHVVEGHVSDTVDGDVGLGESSG